MMRINPIGRWWYRSLAELIATAEEQLLIAAPFISSGGCDLVSDHLTERFRQQGHLKVLTDLSPRHLCDGSLEPQALGSILNATLSSVLWHIPRLHAKVYIADRQRAIITSGNLTAGAFYRNTEYGVELQDPQTIDAVLTDLADFEAAGTAVSLLQLNRYSEVADRVRQTYQRQQSSANETILRAFQAAVRDAEDDLIRLKLAGEAVHAVFARTIRYLLVKYGPMRTPELHQLVQQLHSDLCDDSVDRVIDGKHFGKKWKHAVRTAQQQLKKSGAVVYKDQLWFAT